MVAMCTQLQQTPVLPLPIFDFFHKLREYRYGVRVCEFVCFVYECVCVVYNFVSESRLQYVENRKLNRQSTRKIKITEKIVTTAATTTIAQKNNIVTE